MALKKRFREAARNEFRFLFLFLFCFSGLDDCYHCSNIIVSFFFKLCAKFSLRKLVSSKVGACCPETDSVLLTEKFSINHQINKSPDHLRIADCLPTSLRLTLVLESGHEYLIS